MALRAIIFSVDGTLAHTERDGHRPAFNAAFAEAGLSWHWGESFYETLLVKGSDLLARLRFYAEHFDPVTFARPDFEELIRRLYEIETRNYQRLLAAGAIPLRADIGNLICDARTEGVRLAIASKARMDDIIGLLRANLGPNADAWFDAIVSIETVSAPKPSPEVYKKTLEQLGLPPRDCVAVEGDAFGLASSVGAGIPTVVTMRREEGEDDFYGARMVLHEAEQLSLEKLRLWHATASTS